MHKALDYARERGKRIYATVNTYPQPQGWKRWERAVDLAADLGVESLLAADMGVLGYAASRHPHLAWHLSVQASGETLTAILSDAQQLGLVDQIETEVFSDGSLSIAAISADTVNGYWYNDAG